MSIIYKDPVSDEWYYPENAYILSETDEKGQVLYTNKLFCEIAGYTETELLGEAHNIVRHPDMPRIAFKELWNDIQSKGFWTGMVQRIIFPYALSQVVAMWRTTVSYMLN